MSKLSLKEILTVIHQAGNYHSALPGGARFDGMIRNLSDQERMAIAYVQGTLVMLESRGIDTSSVFLELADPSIERGDE